MPSFYPQRRRGCAISCLIVAIIFILIIAVVVGIIYYFLFMKGPHRPGSYFDIDDSSKKLNTVDCKDSLVCLEQSFKKCEPVKSQTDIEGFAKAEIEVLGISGKNKDCVVYLEIKELKNLPPQLKTIPDFILEKLTKNMTLECLIPEEVYTKGTEVLGDYIGENMTKFCQGPLFDLFDKFGINIEELKD